MNVHDFAELSAGHALGALSPDDERAYLAAVAEHPEWAGIVTADADTAAALAEGVAPVSPPLGMRSTLLRAIAADASAPTVVEDVTDEDVADEDASGADDPDATHVVTTVADPGDTRLLEAAPPTSSEMDATVAIAAADDAPTGDDRAREGAGEAPTDPDALDPQASEPASPPTEVVQAIERRNWSRGLFALVASIVLLVGIGWGTGAIANLWQTPAAVTALDQIQAAPDAEAAESGFDGGTATVHWSQSVGKVVLVADGLPTLPTDRTFELWYIRGDQPISAGTFSADGDAATTELSGTMQPGDTIAVTVEPAGGAPGGAPTTTPLFAIPTA